MYCKSCGEALKAGVKFCGKCGTEAEVTSSDGIRCPKCGAVNKPGARFCRQDGTPLVEAPVTNEPPPAEPVHQQRPVHSLSAETSSDGKQSRLWLVLGALAALAVAVGGYWYFTSRDASPQVAETAQGPSAVTPEASATTEPEGDYLDAQPPAANGGTQPSAQSQVADAPQVSVGDRWVTEVVDHQDPKLNYRAERLVTSVGNDRIVTAVRTIGKDYVRSIDYSGEWALVAAHLPSGATTTYSPQFPYLSFPLQPGRTWQAQVVETGADGKQRLHEVRAKVEAWETITVPAGSFTALKVVLTDDISIDGAIVQQGQDESWYAPDVRRTVKTEETSIDAATGERRRRTISLVEYSLQDGAASARESLASPGKTGSLPDLTPLLAGIEDSCYTSQEFAALLTSLGKSVEVPGGGYVWQAGEPSAPSQYSQAFGALSMEDKGGHTEFKLPLRGTYYGMPVTSLRNGKGNENGISFFALGIDAPAAEVKRVLRGKLNANKRLLYGTEGPVIEAEIVPDGNASLLTCNFSD